MNPYERPNDRWVCGRAAEGRPCRIGPSRWGRCRATYECDPVKKGDRWHCTRPKHAGGPCVEGPRPDGTCSHPIPRCVPQRSLRAKRGLVTWATVVFSLGIVLLVLDTGWRERWLNPGPVSSAHTSAKFLEQATTGGLPGNCAGCHRAAAQPLASWVGLATRAEPGLWEFGKLLRPVTTHPTSMDNACQRCHVGHDFHAKRMTDAMSCTVCHREHAGTDAMRSPSATHCAHCHGDPDRMPAPTAVASRFGVEHPEFRPVRERWRDANTLKFNHARHFESDIPPLNGSALTCATCHELDDSGLRHKPVRFDQHCRACHSLQFDVRNPDLELPHGDAAAVRAFLNSLPVQYADLGRRRGLRQPQEIEAFVIEQLQALYEERRDVEQSVFWASDWEAPQAVAGMAGASRARYPGCLKCHELDADHPPVVLPAVQTSRWLRDSLFRHTTHRDISCAECHAATTSRNTADVLLPSQASCVRCHGPQNVALNQCTLCHDFHREALR